MHRHVMKSWIFFIWAVKSIRKPAKPHHIPLLYKNKHLTTHAAILGMTGSGKTGLGVCLLEEAAIDRLPALVIDPEGGHGQPAAYLSRR